MKKKILTYIKEIDNLLISKNKTLNWDEISKEHLVQISFYQHERLIHLIVTCLFAILSIMVFLTAYIFNDIMLYVLFFVLLCLLVPYIYHYYILENSTQKMYDQYDRMLDKKRQLL